jgi:hypothetical protein
MNRLPNTNTTAQTMVLRMARLILVATRTLTSLY